MLGLQALHRALLRLEPETAHELVIGALRASQIARVPLGWIRRQLRIEDPRLEQRIWETTFANPIGLAAGFDKNASAVHALAAMGFGFVEVGTVTPMPQRGNPKPRVFRYPAQRSLQNALGFNNRGCDEITRRLRQQLPYPVPVGVNIGKNRDTPPAKAVEDYEKLVGALGPLADYLVINVSSPNTPGLRDLQRHKSVVELVEHCRERSDKPLLVKLAPDLEDGEAIELAQAVTDAGANGLVLTNTTVDYSLLPGIEPRGGLSGEVLKKRSFELLRLIASNLAGRSVLISVGGIDSAEEVYLRLKHGASLVQIYTAMVYQGPAMIGRVATGLLELMDRDGVVGIGDLVGAGL